MYNVNLFAQAIVFLFDKKIACHTRRLKHVNQSLDFSLHNDLLHVFGVSSFISNPLIVPENNPRRNYLGALSVSLHSLRYGFCFDISKHTFYSISRIRKLCRAMS